jgi:hypothetical protein
MNSFHGTNYLRRLYLYSKVLATQIPVIADTLLAEGQTVFEKDVQLLTVSLLFNNNSDMKAIQV